MKPDEMVGDTLVNYETKWGPAGSDAHVFLKKHLVLGKRRQLLYLIPRLLKRESELHTKKKMVGWGGKLPLSTTFRTVVRRVTTREPLVGWRTSIHHVIESDQ